MRLALASALFLVAHGAMRLSRFRISLLASVAITLGAAGGAHAQALTEVHLGVDDFVTVLNNTGSGIDLTGYTLRIRSSVQAPIDFALPSGTLEAGEDISVTDMPVAGFDIDLGQNLLWATGSDVSIALLDPADTTIDFVALGSVTLDPPAGISFVPAAVDTSLLNVNSESVLRSSFSGATPTFLQADWVIGGKAGPALGNLTPIPAVPTSPPLARWILGLLLLGVLMGLTIRQGPAATP